MLALSGHMRSKLRGALHTGVKRALATVSSHYKIDLERGSEGYVLLEGDDLAKAQVWSVSNALSLGHNTATDTGPMPSPRLVGHRVKRPNARTLVWNGQCKRMGINPTQEVCKVREKQMLNSS
jgi:hypothetical protein